VLFQVFKAGDSLFDARAMPGGHPPHHDIRALEMLEPFGATPNSISEALGATASVIETLHARHSKDSNSGSPPIFGIERTSRMAAPQLGQH
jgi:hypothetical protein